MASLRMTRLVIGSAATLLALTACGSTVNQAPSPAGSNLSTAGNDGLSGLPGATATANQSGAGQFPNGGSTGTSLNGAAGVTPNGAASTPIPPGGDLGGSSRSRVTTPIEIGLLVGPSSASAQAALGSNKQAASGFGSDVTFKALVQYYNSHGGLGGRKIVPITYTANASDPSYENDAQAACATFTQDHHVAAVITTSGDFWSDNYAACLTHAHVPNLMMSFASTDDAGFAASPSMFATSAVSVDSRVTAMIDEMVQTRHLQRGDKLGVIVEDCPFNLRAYTRTLAPLAQRDGLSIDRRDIDCITGYSDAGKDIAEVQNTVLPYHTANIMKILPLTGWETSVVNFFEDQAQGQNYQPTYFVSSAAQMASQQSNFSANALSRIFGTGWMPDTDVAVYPPSAATLTCRKILASYGIVAQNRADQYLVDASCDPFRYLDAALTSTGGLADPSTLTRALESVGGVIPSSVTLGGSDGLSPSRHFAPTNADEFSYRPGCSCFGYDHRPIQIS